ncbi:phage antirepressor KilAC domain-containing protein [Pseudomonas nitroreducens]|uniref:DNA-binding protein n=1 Tax=Pseudomonas nitroreducens TaxID=46680 RepID=A0A2D0ADQ5_PSENT|nr:phage antirepressor KilAC domain-containing protein [Pseudomonas nitroreducens]OWP50251.1 DNA-binding protein [Pseudomonas nitroreducens]
MSDMDLQEAAKALGTTRPKLITLMRDKGLLNADRLPTHPVRDRLYLWIHEGSWYHPQMGMQFSRSTRVRPAALNWLRDQLGIPRDMPPAIPDPRDVA